MEVLAHINLVAVFGSALFLIAAQYLFVSWRGASQSHVVSYRIVLREMIFQILGYIGVLVLIAFLLVHAPVLKITTATAVGLVWVTVAAGYLVTYSLKNQTKLPVMTNLVWLTISVFGGSLLLNFWPW